MVVEKYLHDIIIHTNYAYYAAAEIDLSGTFAMLMYPQEFSLFTSFIVRSSITVEVISFARNKLNFSVLGEDFMIHVITSNHIPVKSIRQYNDNFILCHHHTEAVPLPFSKTKMKHIFQIYHQDGVDAGEEDYKNTIDLNYSFFPVPIITECLNMILQSIMGFYAAEKMRVENSDDSEDSEEETVVIVACNPEWNRQVVKYLNDGFKSRKIPVECLDIYRHFSIVNTDKLTAMVKNILGSEFVYADEPISFSYALDRALIGMG